MKIVKNKGFTLIELLVVISIIALIAGMIVGLAPAATRQMRLKRVESDLHQLISALESYKNKFGQYPIDNVVTNGMNAAGPILTVNPGTNTLYYELFGTQMIDPYGSRGYDRTQPRYRLWNDPNTLYSPAILESVLHVSGFVNSAVDRKQVPTFLPASMENRTARLKIQNMAKPEFVLLVAPVKGPAGNGKPNPWNYVCTRPTNSTTFDLWADIVIGRTTYRICNWQETPQIIQ